MTGDTDLKMWDSTSAAVMELGRKVVIWGKSSDKRPAEFHVFQHSSSGWNKVRVEKGLCKHESGVFLGSMVVNEQEVLLVSCAHCQMLRSVNLRNADVTDVCHTTNHDLSKMCLGEKNQLFVVDWVQGCPVLQLDFNPTEGEVAGPTTIFQSNMEEFDGICYVPSPFKCIVLCRWSESLIRAVSVENNEVVWEVKGKVDGRTCQPHRIACCQQHQALFAADGRNKRILVLNPRNRKHLQTINLEELGVIVDLFVWKNRLIVKHIDDTFLWKISFFSIR